MGFEEKYKFFNDLGFFTLSNAAPALGKFFKDTITISSPKTELITAAALENRNEDFVYTTISFNDGEVGETHVFLTNQEAMKLAKYVIKKRFNTVKEDDAWDEFSANAIEEVVNILGGNMTEILTVVFGYGVNISVPELKFNKEYVGIYEKDEKLVLNAFTVHLGIEDKIKLYEVAKETYYKELVYQLKNRV